MGLEEDDDVAAADVAVVDEGRPVRWRRERDAIDQDVVADQQRLLHGGGGDLKVLKDEGHDEETEGEDKAYGGERLKRGLAVLHLGLGGGCGDGLFVGGGGWYVVQDSVSALGVGCKG